MKIFYEAKFRKMFQLALLTEHVCRKAGVKSVFWAYFQHEFQSHGTDRCGLV